MPNENEEVIEETEEETPEEELTETTDWEAEAKKARGIAKRLQTKLTKATEKKVEAPVQKESKGFDYAEKAYLKASGIAPDEFTLVQEIMSSTGKSLDDVLEAKYFQSELKERREAKASKDAIPSGSKRSNTSARDQVEYWIAKGEMPPADQRELRQKVVDARIAAEKSKSQFTGQSVA